MKKPIKVRFQNGLTFAAGTREILSYVSDQYHFIDSDDPDFVIFGPYGTDLPLKSDRYVRIGYYCENIVPNMELCEWAFGIPLESEIKHPRYKKIQWHNLNPASLLKMDHDIEGLVATKTKFCNFLYGHRVPYREAFFKALSKYKRVDAPGSSMNNMPRLGPPLQGDKWQQKQEFLAPYKFTIAFENYVYPGYQTEKLYDAMLANSIPIYYGDPYVDRLFNNESFINAYDIIGRDHGGFTRWLELVSQPTFWDVQPATHKSLFRRVSRKARSIGRELKMRTTYTMADINKIVDRVVELDEQDTLYRAMLLQPWLNGNKIPEAGSAVQRWQEIFGHE